jgi:hypothetical protein
MSSSRRQAVIPDCQYAKPRPYRRIAIIGLVVAHLAAGVTLGTCVRILDYDSDSPVGILFIGLTFAQAGLIGFWAALGTARWWLRLIGLVICTALLTGGFACGIEEYDWQTYYIFGFTTTAVTAGLVVLRCFRFRLVLVSPESSPAPPLQFGIRHLLVLTLATAIVTTLALNLDMGPSGSNLLVVTLLSLPFVAVAIAAPWAVLGKTRLPIRSVVMLVVTAVAGTGSFYLLHEIAFTWMLFAQAALLTVTLLVVRACGYRLVRLGKESSPRART